MYIVPFANAFEVKCGMNKLFQLSFLLYLETSLSSLALHELAHVAAAKAFGVRVKRFGVNWKGPYTVREAGSVDQNMLIALTGPAMNLMISACLWPWMPRFAFVNLWLGLFNLLPFKSSDGARALNCYREWRELCVRWGDQEPQVTAAVADPDGAVQ